MTSYRQDEPPLPPRKPTNGVVALGVISIVYASFFLIIFPTVVFFASPFIFKAIERICKLAGITGYQTTEAMRTFSSIYLIISIVLGVALLIGGIGLLRLKHWARMLSIWASASVIAWAFVGTFVGYFLFYPTFLRMMEGRKDVAAHLIGSIIGTSIGMFFRLGYLVVLIILLNLNSIKIQFRTSDSHFD